MKMIRAIIQRTTKCLLNMREQIRFDLPFQRNFEWKKESNGRYVECSTCHGQHVFFDKLAFTELDRVRYVDEQAIWQSLDVVMEQDTDINGASFGHFMF
ncbi:hypothetical protein [Paenibacillus sp. BAC0078]